MKNREEGRLGEDIAVEYLKKNGYRILERNYIYEHGEIDVIAGQNDTLVFVEVKARRTKGFGEPEDAITPKKQEQIRKTAEGYLFEHDIDDTDCRFDVIAIQYEKNQPKLRHIEDAF